MKYLPFTLAILALTSAASSAKTGWEDDLDKGLAKAKAEKKIALVDFTGSDWCGACIQLDKEVFSKKEFKDYAKEKLVLIEIDFPQGKPLSKKQTEKNETLREKQKIEGFPTLILMDGDGKEIGRTVGYDENGPAAFIAELEKLMKKAASK